MPEKISGSCLCSRVKYTINSDVKGVGNCHCNTCKKITGGVFATIAIVAEVDLEITAGQEDLSSYQISENLNKNFCLTCGTPIFNQHKKYPGRCMVHVGSLDEPALALPAMNIFCENMLPWVKKLAELKSFEQGPTA